MAYNDKVIDLCLNPVNQGSMDKTNVNVGTSLVGSAACGDMIKFQILVDEDNETIKDVKFKAFGCASAIASSSYLTTIVLGKSLDYALKIKDRDIADALGLPPIKYHCSVLAEEAINGAIEDYMSKKKINKDTKTDSSASIGNVG